MGVRALRFIAGLVCGTEAGEWADLIVLPVRRGRVFHAWYW